MTKSRSKGDAEIFAIFLVLVAAVVAITFTATENMNRAACLDYGKVRIFGTVYDCHPPMEQKK